MIDSFEERQVRLILSTYVRSVSCFLYFIHLYCNNFNFKNNCLCWSQLFQMEAARQMSTSCLSVWRLLVQRNSVIRLDFSPGSLPLWSSSSRHCFDWLLRGLNNKPIRGLILETPRYSGSRDEASRRLWRTNGKQTDSVCCIGMRGRAVQTLNNNKCPCNCPCWLEFLHVENKSSRREILCFRKETRLVTFPCCLHLRIMWCACRDTHLTRRWGRRSASFSD